MAVAVQRSGGHDLSPPFITPSICPSHPVTASGSCFAKQMQFSCLYCNEKILVTCQPEGHLLVLIGRGIKDDAESAQLMVTHHRADRTSANLARADVVSYSPTHNKMLPSEREGNSPSKVTVKCESIQNQDDRDVRDVENIEINLSKKVSVNDSRKVKKKRCVVPVPVSEKRVGKRKNSHRDNRNGDINSKHDVSSRISNSNLFDNSFVSSGKLSAKRTKLDRFVTEDCDVPGLLNNDSTSFKELEHDLGKVKEGDENSIVKQENVVNNDQGSIISASAGTKKSSRKVVHFRLKSSKGSLKIKKNNKLLKLTTTSPGSVSEEKRAMLCDLCNRTVCGRARLKQHLKTHMNPAPSHQCDICHKSFKQLHKLKLHKSTVHDKVRAFMCVVCHKFLSSCSSLRDHMTTHQRKMADICHLCGKEFYFRQGLTEHLKVAHEGKRYRCPTCGKEFTTKNCLKTHRISHMDEVEKRKHCVICDICGKMFKERRRLNLHYRVHTDDKPYKCDICGKRYCQKIGLITHMKTHTAEKSFSCAVCGEKFSHRSALSEHKKLHGQLPQPPPMPPQMAPAHHHPDLGVGRINHPPPPPPPPPPIHPAPPPPVHPPVCFVDHYPYYLYQ